MTLSKILPQQPLSRVSIELMDLENETYSIESFYNYWKKNSQAIDETIEDTLKNQFAVGLL